MWCFGVWAYNLLVKSLLLFHPVCRCTEQPVRYCRHGRPLSCTAYVHHITSHHITSHRITSHHITSHHITSHHITSHHITSHHITHVQIARRCPRPPCLHHLISDRTSHQSQVQQVLVCTHVLLVTLHHHSAPSAACSAACNHSGACIDRWVCFVR